MLEWFWTRLTSFGADTALIYPCGEQGERVATYADIVERAARLRGELTARGVQAGSVVAVEGSFTLGATSLLLALVELGAIVAPLTREMRPHRDQFLDICEATLLAEFSPDDELQFIDVIPGHSDNALLSKLRERGSPGLIIFSSGSTGKPKAILHDFGQLLKKFEKRRQKKTTLCFLLFDHIGGIDTLLNTFSSGGTVVTVARREPVTVATAIQTHRVHTLPTSPTFLNLFLMAGVADTHDLSSLQVIAYGTEPMPAGTLTRLSATFPNVALVQTYGMSELGVLRSRSKDSNSPWLEFREDGYEIKVVDGLLWVKASSAMLGYLNAPDLFDEDGWLNTQDAVEIDGKYMRILGRQTDLINVGGQKVYPNEVEGHLLELANVQDVAVYGRPHPMTGQMVAAKVRLKEPEPLAEFKVRMHKFCRERLAAYQIPRFVELTEDDQFGARFKKVRP